VIDTPDEAREALARLIFQAFFDEAPGAFFAGSDWEGTSSLIVFRRRCAIKAAEAAISAGWTPPVDWSDAAVRVALDVWFSSPRPIGASDDEYCRDMRAALAAALSAQQGERI
jgi:hypothetical protein